jgi:hypothetical protein
MVAIRSRASCFSLSKVSSSKAINLRTCCLLLSFKQGNRNGWFEIIIRASEPDWAGQIKLKIQVEGAKGGKNRAATVYPAPKPVLSMPPGGMRFATVCIVSLALSSGTIAMLTAPGLTLLFLGVVVGLGVCFVWMLWEIEQMSKPQLSKQRRNSGRFG